MLYPGETSSDRVYNPANYSFSRLLIRLNETDRIPIYLLNQSDRSERYGNIRFIHFTKPNFARVLARCMLGTNTLIVNQLHVYRKYAELMRRVVPRSRLVVRLGGVYHGRDYLDTETFREFVRVKLGYLKHADMLISTADGTPVDAYMERVGVEPRRYRKWMNGFPVIPNADGRQRGDRVLCIARLSEEKAVDYVIESYARALPQLHRPHRLVIVGDGPQRDELQRLTRQLGIEAHVDFPGYDDDVAPHLYGARVLLSGMANNSVMEAIATGTPVIAVDLGETAALYGSYPNVRIVPYPPGGCGAIASEHRESLIAETARHIVDVVNCGNGASAQSPARELFGWDERLDAELALYDALFERPGG